MIRRRGEEQLAHLGRSERLLRLLEVAPCGFTLPKELVLFFKNLLYLNGFAATLARDSNLFDEIPPIFAYFVQRYPEELAAIVGDLVGGSDDLAAI